MNISLLVVDACVLTLVVSAAPPVWADDVGEAHAIAAAAPTLRLEPLLPSPESRGPTSPAPTRGADALWGIGVVELPSQSVQPGSQRPHHALSLASDPPRRLLRSIGIDATECTTRVGSRTRVRQFGNGTHAEVQGQVMLACRL